LVSFTALNTSQHFYNLKKDENAIKANGLKVYLKVNNLETSRLGINISSKGTNAVNRNKFKRRIKEAVRGLEIQDNIDIYFIGSIQSFNMDLKDIIKVLKSHPKLTIK
jgi:ribonuclease P protein component